MGKVKAPVSVPILICVAEGWVRAELPSVFAPVQIGRVPDVPEPVG